MNELEVLLENYWISKEDDKELYYKVKDALPMYKSFLAEKLGYQVLLNPYLIKLEKLPGKAEVWMGIQDFQSKMEYAFLCLILIFLEDKGKEEQFVLSSITEFIQGNYLGDEKVDWTLYRHRKNLINVLRFSVDIGLIKLDDGDEQKFASTTDIEVLYESTGLSRYFVRNFTVNILDYNSYRDIEAEDWMEIDKEKGIFRRQRVYRKILMSPIVYNQGTEDVDYAYIKNYRNMIANDLENYFDYELHVHKNGAMIILDREKNMKDTFPANKAISDVVLQINAMILSEIKNGNLKLKTDDTIIISKVAFSALVEKVKKENDFGWSKEYREMKLEILSNEIINYMKGFNLLESVQENKELKINPLVGKIIGVYPKDFIKDGEDK